MTTKRSSPEEAGSRENCWQWFRNPAFAPPGMYIKPVIQNGKNYQPQLVIAGFLLSTVSHLSFTLFTSLPCCDEGNQSATCFWQNEKEKSQRYPLHDEVMKPDDFCPISENLQNKLLDNYLGPLGNDAFLMGMNEPTAQQLLFILFKPRHPWTHTLQWFMSFDWRMADCRDVYIWV